MCEIAFMFAECYIIIKRFNKDQTNENFKSYLDRVILDESLRTATFPIAMALLLPLQERVGGG
jgi:trehalose/maltose hydrolase-like predicted phosphorylase